MNTKSTMSVKHIYPHYVVRGGTGDCDCHIDVSCDCMPELLLTKNGSTGFGIANWTYTDDTCPRHKDDSGKAYWCEFLGLPGFWAIGETDAADELRTILDNMGIAASVQYRDNREAINQKAKM